jgi:alginate O-acetyltransferase complex protein AlgI
MLNFNNPYLADGLGDFWKRWHISLSTWFRDYVYIPLGGNRKGNVRRYANLMLTMILGGLWHGAGWTFMLWGFLHGLYLCVDHFWHAIGRTLHGQSISRIPGGRIFGWMLTFVCVLIAWVFFRAETFDAAVTILRAMSGIDGIQLPMQISGRIGSVEETLLGWGISTQGEFIIHPRLWVAGLPLILLSMVLLAMPNTNQIGERSPQFFQTHPTSFSLFIAFVATIAILSLGKISEFLYFQF